MTHPVQILFMEQAHAPLTETALLSRLHPDEQARYRGFSHGPRRLSWLAGRALMLAALEKVLGTVDARALRSQESGGVAYGAGEPHLNLSHSGELLGVALSSLPVGFDLERPRPRAAARSADRIFSAQETTWLDALPAPEQLDGFYSLWTLKEAACKAVELTLWDCMKTARFELPEGRFSPQAPLPAGPWSCLHARLEPDWHLAVAVSGTAGPLEPACWRLAADGSWHEIVLVRPARLYAR